MRVGTYPTRYFATLGPSRLQPPFIGTYTVCVNIVISFFNIGQVSNPIHLFSNLQSLKFLLNSRYSLFCYALLNYLYQALLIPKLRSQFAEFLQYYYYNTLTFSVNLSVATLVRFFLIAFFKRNISTKTFIYISINNQFT